MSRQDTHRARVVEHIERRRIITLIQMLHVTDAHDPPALAATDNKALYFHLLNEGIQAGYRAVIREIEKIKGAR